MDLTFLFGNDYAFCRSSRFLPIAAIANFAGAIRFLEPETFCRIGQLRVLKE